ncbi:hypothetical protein [Saccharomonospora saliphila]|uniref:hypothetical protein n=1 Tax=Saccharomonospora saliphila TaxID=369829 RepID=UPI0012F877DE|nr:hypothetical protein [Saccharomonospora saliphila]
MTAIRPRSGGYVHVGHYPFGRGEVGAFDVYWSSTAKRNCLIVNRQNEAYGVPGDTYARIAPGGWDFPNCPDVGCDSGYFSYYAGPAYTPAGVDMTHRCVDVSGLVELNGQNNFRGYYGLNCG